MNDDIVYVEYNNMKFERVSSEPFTPIIHIIPEMTDPLSKYWSQPDRLNILVDNEHAIMSEEIFEQLKDYTRSQPSGVYPGKMWRIEILKVWNLCWFGELYTEGKHKYVSNHYRIILIQGE